METSIIDIKGMSCGGCTGSVQRVLSALDGVTSVEVSLEQANATVTYDPSKVSLQQLHAGVADAGFEVL